MIATWAIPLTHIDIQRVKRDRQRRDDLFGVAASWLDEKDHWATTKPWSLSTLARIDGVVAIQISTLTEEAAARLNAHVDPGAVIKLGAQSATVIAPPVPLTCTHPTVIANEPAERAHVVAFDTVTFRNRTRSSPFPDPASMLRSLASRWNALYATQTAAIEITHKRSASIWISDIEGRTHTLKIPLKPPNAAPGKAEDAKPLNLSAFVGRVRYVAENHDSATALTRLLRFAEYAGIGSYTTRGLGRITREPTWQPD